MELDFERWSAFVCGVALGSFLTLLGLAWCLIPALRDVVRKVDVVVESNAVANQSEELWVEHMAQEIQQPHACGGFVYRLPWVLPFEERRPVSDSRTSRAALAVAVCESASTQVEEYPEFFLVRRDEGSGPEFVSDYNIGTMEVEWRGSPGKAKVFRGPAWAKFWDDQGYDLIPAEIGGAA